MSAMSKKNIYNRNNCRATFIKILLNVKKNQIRLMFLHYKTTMHMSQVKGYYNSKIRIYSTPLLAQLQPGKPIPGLV